MAYSTCLGDSRWPHQETRTCDGCDRCPHCARFNEINLWCWRCCGKLVACLDCSQKLASHVVEGGEPQGEFRFPEALAGYRAARSITRARTPKTTQEALDRYPILIGHMICNSLGYFTPQAAANALLAYLQGRVNYCEWYYHMAQGDPIKCLEVGRSVVEQSFLFRRNHSGMMAEYQRAKALVDQVRKGGEGPDFASWF